MDVEAFKQKWAKWFKRHEALEDPPDDDKRQFWEDACAFWEENRASHWNEMDPNEAESLNENHE